MNKDLEVQSLVSEFRLVTIEQLKRVRPQGGTRRNLRRLVSEDHIYCRIPKSKNDPYVYAPSKLDRKSEERIPHDLMITDVHIALSQTGMLKTWEQGKAAWKGKVHQDAFCVLEHPGYKPPHNNFYFFVEADTGVETYQEIGEKIRIYNDYPDKPFRVLFVTKKLGWAKKLAKAAEIYVSKEAHRFYLFVQVSEFLSNPLEQVYFMPYENEQQALLPNLL